MTTYNLRLKAKSELTPHPTAQYWRKCQVEELFEMPFMELIFKAAQVHREHFDPQAIQLSTLLSIKPEDVRKNANIVLSPLAMIPGLKSK